MFASQAGEFFKRRLSELFGLGLLSLAVFVCLSVTTYHSGDPSFNRRASGFVSNIAGTTGAHVADLAMQVLGLASALLVVVPAVWGVLLLRRKEIRWFWFRLMGLCVALAAASGVLALFESPAGWPIGTGLGGYTGWFLKKHLGGAFGTGIFTLTAVAMAVTSFVFALGLSRRGWGLLLRGFALVASGVLSLFAMAWEALSDRRSAWRGLSLPELELGSRWEMFRENASARWEALRERFRRNDDEEEDEEEADADAEEPALVVKPRKAPEPKAVKEPAKPKERKAPAKPAAKSNLELRLGQNFDLPDTDLLAVPKTRAKPKQLSESALQQNAKMLEAVLGDFGIVGKITGIKPGPVVTLYELEPAPGTRSSRVIGLSDDIARSMSAISARIAVIPGQNAIGIELPNATRETVYLREMIENDDFQACQHGLPLALGKDIGGAPFCVDLAKMPHLLVAGTTGSGKSVAVNTMILSLLYRLTPEECRFIMIDPKMLELSVYQDIPHLLTPVVTEPPKAIVALKWVVKEMENRYRLMANLGVRNIAGYNKRIKEAAGKGEKLTRSVQTGFDIETGKPIIENVELDMSALPFIVVIIDEIADLMVVAKQDIETSIQRLAQMARAAGIHLIMATQRPSVDVITGVIKANLPTRISFQVTSKIDSRTILGEQGAEQLLGQGDMLYMAGGGRITRVHGPFVSDQEVEDVVTFLKTQGEPNYVTEVTEEQDEGGALGSLLGGEGEDSLYDQAVAIIQQDRKASTSYLQRKLKIGYNRAADLIDRMEKEGVISAPNHAGKREILVPER